VRAGIIAMVANMVLNLIFVLLFHHYWSMGHIGLALATSGSACLNAGLLYRGLRKTEHMPSIALLRGFALQLLVGLVLMAIVLSIGNHFWLDWSDWSLWQRVWRLAILCFAGGSAYLIGLVLSGMRLRHFYMSSAH